MTNLVSDIDAWLTATALGVLMCAGWWFGHWRGQRVRGVDRDEATGQLTGASVALLGLLLAFTFSMSLERHEKRRLMVVDHANTIGDFATCASMVKEPVRSQLKQLLHRYVTHVLSIRRPRVTEDELQAALRTNDQMHNEIQALVKVAIDEGTPVAIPLVNNFNDLTSSHDERLAAMRNRLPVSIVILLCLSAIVSMIQIGMQERELNERVAITGIGFVILVCMCVWATLDFNQLQGQMIKISQEPMLRLQSSLAP